jgi:thiol-disulfide isomerase/thioredoxin
MATRSARKRRRAEKRFAELPLGRRLWLRLGGARLLWVVFLGLVLGLGFLLASSSGGAVQARARIIDPVRNEETAGLGVVAAEGQLAPNFEAMDFSGKRVRLSDFQGKVVLVNFYASWCTACREEIPAYQRIYDRYREQGFEILAVNNGESRDLAQRYLRGNGGRFTGVLDPGRTIVEAYRVRGMPVSVFIDRDGVIVKYVAGEVPEAAADRLVRALVTASSAGSLEPIAPVSAPVAGPGQ